MNVGDVYVVNGAVVIEVPTAPIAAFITLAEIAEAVINPAVEANVRAPVADMPDIGSGATTHVPGTQ